MIANSKIYFTRDYDEGELKYYSADLWESDGTASNTKLVESSPGNYITVNNQIGLIEFKNAFYYITLTGQLYRIGTPSTSVIEIANNDFEVILYPNPANYQLTLKTDEKSIGSIFTVLNIMGQTVRSGKINSDNTLLEVGDLPSGIYLVQIQSKEGGGVSRFIKE